MPSGQDNAAIVRRLWDVWAGGEVADIDQLVDDDFTNFGMRRTDGRAGMRFIVSVWRTAFPDLSVEIQDEIVHDDIVVHRVLMRGTHMGEFQAGIGPGRIMGAMPATGRTFAADQIHIHRVRDGKVVEHAASRNDLLMLNQLGLLPGIRPVSEQAGREPTSPARGPST
jgi:ketosteroid isomerase-like protein